MPSASWGSGTRPSRRTDPLGRLWLAGAAAALFTLYTFTSRSLPTLQWQADAVVSSLVSLPLLALILFGLLPLRRAGSRLLIIAAAALPVAVVASYLQWMLPADLAKILLAAALGSWMAAQVQTVAVIVLIAGLSTIVDMYSVFAGPTKVLLARAPQTVDYFVVTLPLFGYTLREAYSALGTSDLLFFALYLGATLVFDLRLRLTLVCMTASFLATMVIGLWVSALPALPLLAVAFVAANGDLLWRNLRSPSRPA